MRFSTLRRTLLALALVAPVGAARPAETATAALPASGFEGSFDSFRQLPARTGVEDGAVDLAAIAPARAPAAESMSGREIGGGMASYYGRQFDGRRTASGERFDMGDLTAAHRTLPFGSRVRVTNAATGRSVVVRINDRGPFHGGRVIDVSQAAAERLGLIAPGQARVRLTLVES